MSDEKTDDTARRAHDADAHGHDGRDAGIDAEGGGEREDEARADPMPDKDKPLYVISVAAELVDMHPQTLRLYERKGLIEPSRSAGKTRLYSQRNIEQLRDIRRLTQELGVNLAGVEEIIRLRRNLDDLQARMERRIGTLQDRIQSEMSSMRHALPAPADEGEEVDDDDAEAAADAAIVAELLKRRDRD